MNVFNRTKCACADCVSCCKRQPGPLIPGDLERIAAYLGETVDEAKRHFVASGGAVVKNIATGTLTRIGSITPDSLDGRCVFLDQNDRCKIHEVAPAGCAYFDTHMNIDAAMPRSLRMVELQKRPDYQRLRDQLPLAKTYKPNRY
jgi:Fe-S-cluster containining protein